MTLPQPPKEMWKDKEQFIDWAIFLGYRGSISHGLYDGNQGTIDDVDLISICVPPQSYFYGLKEFGSRGTQEAFEGKWDIVAYDIRKLVRMLAVGNPNVLSLLWLPSKYYLKNTEAWNILTLGRQLFATKNVYKSFAGYANNQFKKMETGSYQGYMGAKRKALFDKNGYDCKNASHLIRLLRLGSHFMLTGDMPVDRSEIDAKELRDIKNGEYSLSKVKEMTEALFKEIISAVEKSKLPEKPDFEAIDRLCQEVVKQGIEDLHKE